MEAKHVCNNSASDSCCARELSDVEFGGDYDMEENETDADYRARMMNVDTFLRLNESISTLRVIGKRNPEYVSEVQKILHSSVCEDNKQQTVATEAVVKETPQTQIPTEDSFANMDETVKVKTHAHLIYHGDLLQLSKETVFLTVTKRDMTLFTRIIDCFKRMIMGQHTDSDVANMRRDHDLLIAMWDDVPDNAANIGSEIKNMMRSMLETPLYYTNSCMALIACGQMLRNLYAETEHCAVQRYEQLIAFVRKHMRHNPEDPFECDCSSETTTGETSGPCSEEFKSLLSMIMEVPPIVHNQTYLLQILAYLMYNKFGREGVFVNNLKNMCSPGLLDKIPTRLAMLMGTLDEAEIRVRYKRIRKETQHLIPLKDRMMYSKHSLEKLIQFVHHPRVQALIDILPGANFAAVELRLPKCGVEKKRCLNKEFDDESIMSRERNNNGKNKCCGYLRQDPFDILLSSISLAQLSVYVFTDPRSGSTKSRQHFFVRDIITAMAGNTVKIKLDTLEEMFCHLDRTRVFKGFHEHPFMMTTLQELFTSYIDYMKDAAEKYKETGKKRRMRRYLRKVGAPSETI